MITLVRTTDAYLPLLQQERENLGISFYGLETDLSERKRTLICYKNY